MGVVVIVGLIGLVDVVNRVDFVDIVDDNTPASPTSCGKLLAMLMDVKRYTVGCKYMTMLKTNWYCKYTAMIIKWYVMLNLD